MIAVMIEISFFMGPTSNLPTLYHLLRKWAVKKTCGKQALILVLVHFHLRVADIDQSFGEDAAAQVLNGIFSQSVHSGKQVVVP